MKGKVDLLVFSSHTGLLQDIAFSGGVQQAEVDLSPLALTGHVEETAFQGCDAWQAEVDLLLLLSAHVGHVKERSFCWWNLAGRGLLDVSKLHSEVPLLQDVWFSTA